MHPRCVALAILTSVIAGLAAKGDTSLANVQLSGEIVFWSDRGANSIDLWLVSADGTGLRRLTRREGSDFSPRWSPRGDRIVFHAYGPPNPSTAHGDIYVVGSNGRGLRRLTRNRADEFDPTWSPNGRKILFVAHVGRGTDLFVMRSDGTDRRRLTHTRACEHEPDWSPDGTRLVASSGCGSIRRIVVLHTDGSRPRRIAQAGGGGPVWSPDGRRIAFTSGSSIRIVDADGSLEVRLPFEVAGQGISWSPDGQMLAFSRAEMSYCSGAEVNLVYVAFISGGNPIRVTSDPCTEGDKSPDWRR